MNQIKFTGDKGPWREEYRKFESEHTNPQRMMSVLFNDANYVRKNVNPEDLMWGLYWIAVGMQDIEIPISFMIFLLRMSFLTMAMCELSFLCMRC